jgi:hypothetical protein
MKIHGLLSATSRQRQTVRFYDNGGESGSVISRKSFNTCFALSSYGKVMNSHEACDQSNQIVYSM